MDADSYAGQILAQQTFQFMIDACFDQCVSKPGSTLDTSEQKCLARCQDRYQEAYTRCFERLMKKTQERTQGEMEGEQF